MDDFVIIPESANSADFKPINFLKIIPGVPLQVRILDKKAYSCFKHYIPAQKLSVTCLGDGVCPICLHNKKLADENPGVRWGQIRGYIARQNRFLVNVYNRTLVKVTPNGAVIYPAANGQFPHQDPATGEILANLEARPLNRVEILERGSTLFSQLNVTHKTIIDPTTKQPLGVWNYDIIISATGQGRKMVTNITPMPHFNDPVSVPEADLYKLEEVPLRLTAEEIYDLLRGVSLRDIYAKRRAEDDRAGVGKADDFADGSDEIGDSLDDLFAD